MNSKTSPFSSLSSLPKELQAYQPLIIGKATVQLAEVRLEELKKITDDMHDLEHTLNNLKTYINMIESWLEEKDSHTEDKIYTDGMQKIIDTCLKILSLEHISLSALLERLKQRS